ncbi:unnamed protein product [Lampetra planeri]
MSRGSTWFVATEACQKRAVDNQGDCLYQPRLVSGIGVTLFGAFDGCLGSPGRSCAIVRLGGERRFGVDD